MSEPAPSPSQPSFGRWMGSMWLFTVLRIALFGALWLIVWACQVPVLIAGMLAAVLSVPLSFVLLAKPRNAFVAQMQTRIDARRIDRDTLDHELDPDADTR